MKGKNLVTPILFVLFLIFITNSWAGDGNLYVASQGSNEVLRYNGITGTFIDDFVTAGLGGLTWPTGLIFGPDENLYVASVVAHIYFQ